MIFGWKSEEVWWSTFESTQPNGHRNLNKIKIQNENFWVFLKFKGSSTEIRWRFGMRCYFSQSFGTLILGKISFFRKKSVKFWMIVTFVKLDVCVKSLLKLLQNYEKSIFVVYFMNILMRIWWSSFNVSKYLKTQTVNSWNLFVAKIRSFFTFCKSLKLGSSFVSFYFCLNW